VKRLLDLKAKRAKFEGLNAEIPLKYKENDLYIPFCR
jgi:hypothetical protein